MRRVIALIGFVLLVSNHAIAKQGDEAAVDLPAPSVARSDNAGVDVVDFQRHQFTVGRARGKVRLDGVEITRDYVERNAKEVRLIETFDALQFDSTREFRAWVKMLRGTRTYTYDNVHFRRQDGSIEVTPLVLLPQETRKQVDPMWRDWLDDQRDIEHSKLVAAKALQAEREHYRRLEQTVKKQATALEQLSQVQDIDEHADLWVVHLASQGRPGIGVANGGFQVATGVVVSQPDRGIRVEVYARNSRDAIESALAKHPGYRLTGARKQRFRF